ncbi:MAG TPA: adenylate/guanylate cyclase domain-containing protein [Bacteroidota bacterium]|nr:adenylate/guanylate cyclase domain-containing protein [Bacteroidota bacterium]
MYLKYNPLTLTEKESIVHGERLDVVVVYADLRSFSVWSLGSTAGEITRVIETIYDSVIQLAFFYKHTFHKFLGDGFVLIWEVKDHGSRAEALHWALGASLEIHKRYWYIAEKLKFPSPHGFGIGIACGEVVKIDPETFVPELNETDFVGYPMNSGARLQKLAGPFGTVLDNLGVQTGLGNPDRVFRKQKELLRLELLQPTEKSTLIAQKLTGLHAADIMGFQYVVWPYLMNSLWKVDGRP